MSKPLLFYTIDERTDICSYCKRKGLRPYKVENKVLDNCLLEQVIQYVKGDFLYEVLDCDQCYSGYMVTLMRLPKLSYEELLNVALTSKYLDERAGAIGTILKDYPNQFEDYLLVLSEVSITSSCENKHIKRMITFINNFIKENTSYVWRLDRILLFCEKISYQINCGEKF